MPYKINELAKLAGVSVRTLHYYDQIGLLKPSGVSPNGYRYYEKRELLKLQQILFYRELGMPLNKIKDLLAAPDFDIKQALAEHKRLINIKRKRLDQMIITINKTINHMNKRKKLSDQELYDPFRDNDVKQYQAEAKLRWGRTDAYKQSMARVKKMTKAEMEKMKADGKKLTQQLADSMALGAASQEVQALIAEHYRGIQFFYDCPLEMYANLGRMYVADKRFSAYYERFRPGLAAFMRDAIDIYCANNSSK